MPSPSIGSTTFYVMRWTKAPPYVRSRVFRQPNRDGNSHSVGKKYAEASIITTEQFLSTYLLEDDEIKEYAALCGDTQTVVMVDNTGNTVTHNDVWIESVRIVKSNVCVGPGATEHVIVAEFTVYLPSDW